MVIFFVFLYLFMIDYQLVMVGKCFDGLGVVNDCKKVIIMVFWVLVKDLQNIKCILRIFLLFFIRIGFLWYLMFGFWFVMRNFDFLRVFLMQRWKGRVLEVDFYLFFNVVGVGSGFLLRFGVMKFGYVIILIMSKVLKILSIVLWYQMVLFFFEKWEERRCLGEV